jgi:outer membrane lipoprotein-sorting protein
MKNRSFWIGILLCAVLASAAFAQSADEVIGKYLEARGGLDKIQAVESARLTGTMSMGGQMEAPIVWMIKRPDKIRIEFTIQGQKGIQAYDGESGWSLMPFTGITDPVPMSAEEAAIFSEQADFDGPFVDSETKGYVIEYVGEEEIEGTAAHKLKVTNKHGDVSYVYFDAEHYLEIKTEGKRTVRGQEIEFEATQGDYKEVGGLMFAHSIENRPKGAPAGQTVTIETIELDVEIPDSDFAMPAVEKPAEAEETEETEATAEEPAEGSE